MTKTVGMILLLVGVASTALATPTAPEIDPGSAVSALALVSGAFLMIRRRRHK